MATNTGGVIEYDLDEEVDRAEGWNGDFAELEDLADTVRSAWKERDLEAVQAMCEALLMHDRLPLFQRGKFEAYMCVMEGEDATERLETAAACLQRAAQKVAEAGVNNADIVRWQKKVRRMQARVVPFDEWEAAEQHKARQAAKLDAPLLSILDATAEVDPGEATEAARRVRAELAEASNAAAADLEERKASEEGGKTGFEGLLDVGAENKHRTQS
ncbi:hypothetical protein LTR37_002400 [Vermiconidia calcicola]|uniref:Uncharacterized protein n=1 Tax=Vermiconidia calcicola TaxID=1690605 RepID=A0ACC3NT35_9PEZI|nr:hypothetical protein LTR37_002400 [Vermiconidia calcicola]